MQDTKEFKLLMEQYPRIGNKVDIMWGTQECHDYLHNLMFDTRDNSRKGFSKEVGTAILKLQTMHRTDFPYYGKDVNDPWASDNFS